MDETAKRPPSLKWVGVVCAIAVLAAALRYATRHPLPIGYDETMYVNQVLFDRNVLVNDGVLAFARKQVGTETWRPPAYRLAAAPIALVAGASPVTLRLLSLAAFMVTIGLLYLAGRELGGPPTGIAWAGAAGLAIGTFSAILHFGTETALFPAIALLLLGIARLLCRGPANRTTCFILLASAAVGGLSKLSFFVVFLPIAAMTWWLAAGKRRSLVLSLGAGLLLAAPWWLFNWRDAVHYASYASGFERHGFPWIPSAVFDLLGPPLAIGAAATLILVAMHVRAGPRRVTGPPRAFIVIGLAGVLPLLLLHVLGSNHNMRLLAPAWLPAAGILAVMLQVTGALLSPMGRRAVTAVLLAQAAAVAILAGSRQESQRDWMPLRAHLDGEPPSETRIAMLGDAAVFNAPQVLYAWRRHGETIEFDRLWRWERGPIRWEKILAIIDSADAVLIPMLPGTRSLPDNRHNAELTSRLLAQPGSWMVDSLPPVPGDRITYLVFSRPHGSQ